MTDLLRPDRIPAVTAVRMTGARNRTELPLLVLGPSLGTSASACWGDCAPHLADVFDVLAWDLPGHGHNRAVPDEQFSMAELAAGVLRVVDDVLAQRGEVGGPFFHAGASVGGAVGLQLLLEAPERITAAVLLSTGAEIGEPTRGSAPRQARQEADDDGYDQARAALAEFDVRDRLAEIAERGTGGRLIELDGVAQLAPAETPETVARLLREHLLGEVFAEIDNDADGRGAADSPGLDRRSLALVTLTALVARGRHEELAMHLRAARNEGLTVGEIREVLRQTVIHCGVPEADTAFRIARQVLVEEEAEDT